MVLPLMWQMNILRQRWRIRVMTLATPGCIWFCSFIGNLHWVCSSSRILVQKNRFTCWYESLVIFKWQQWGKIICSMRIFWKNPTITHYMFCFSENNFKIHSNSFHGETNAISCPVCTYLRWLVRGRFRGGVRSS